MSSRRVIGGDHISRGLSHPLSNLWSLNILSKEFSLDETIRNPQCLYGVQRVRDMYIDAILWVAYNKAAVDLVGAFYYAVRDNSAFRGLAYQFQVKLVLQAKELAEKHQEKFAPFRRENLSKAGLLEEHESAKELQTVKDAAQRLRLALNRVLRERELLPPWGPDLIPGDEPAQTNMYWTVVPSYKLDKNERRAYELELRLDPILPSSNTRAAHTTPTVPQGGKSQTQAAAAAGGATQPPKSTETASRHISGAGRLAGQTATPATPAALSRHTVNASDAARQGVSGGSISPRPMASSDSPARRIVTRDGTRPSQLARDCGDRPSAVAGVVGPVSWLQRMADQAGIPELTGATTGQVHGYQPPTFIPHDASAQTVIRPAGRASRSGNSHPAMLGETTGSDASLASAAHEESERLKSLAIRSRVSQAGQASNESSSPKRGLTRDALIVRQGQWQAPFAAPAGSGAQGPDSTAAEAERSSSRGACMPKEGQSRGSN